MCQASELRLDVREQKIGVWPVLFSAKMQVECCMLHDVNPLDRGDQSFEFFDEPVGSSREICIPHMYETATGLVS